MTLDPVAIYGALLATLLAAVQIRQFWLDRARVRIEALSMGEVVYRGEDEGFVPAHPESLAIRVTNHGRRPAYVPQIGLRYASLDPRHGMFARLPHRQKN